MENPRGGAPMILFKIFPNAFGIYIEPAIKPCAEGDLRTSSQWQDVRSLLESWVKCQYCGDLLEEYHCCNDLTAPDEKSVDIYAVKVRFAPSCYQTINYGCSGRNCPEHIKNLKSKELQELAKWLHTQGIIDG